jgi:hypothetical protein
VKTESETEGKYGYRIVLDCLHIIIFARKASVPVGKTVWCPKCRSEETIYGYLQEWRADCTSCRYSRRFGADRAAAFLAGQRHGTLRGHVVSLVYDGEVSPDELVTWEAPEIPMDDPHV